MHSFHQLLVEHQSLDEEAKALIEHISGDSANAQAAYIQLIRIARALDDHLTHEDTFLYSRVMRESDLLMEEAVAAFEQAFEDLKQDWDHYLGAWPLQRISAQWPVFQNWTQRMMSRLRERIAQENEVLYPLALRFGHISLIDARLNSQA